MRSDPLPRLAKRLFLLVFPSLRPEIACVASVVGAFLFLESDGPREIPEVILKEWRNGEYVMCIIFPLLLLTLAAGLAMPFVALIARGRLHRRLRGLVIVSSTLVLVGALCWTAEQHFADAASGPRVLGISLYVVLAVVALLEFAVVAFGVFQLLDDKALSERFMGPRHVNTTLLVVNLSVTVLLVSLRVCYDLLHPSTAALAALNSAFIVSRAWPQRSIPAAPAVPGDDLSERGSEEVDR